MKMEKAINARNNLMANWRTFLAASLTRWVPNTSWHSPRRLLCGHRFFLSMDSAPAVSELHVQGLLDCIPHAESFCIGLHTTADLEDQRPYLGPTWMDDTCLCLAAESPEEIVRISSQAQCLLLHNCECVAMTPNLTAGKSELMLVFQGRGARKAKLKYFGPSATCGLPIVTDGGTRTLTIVTSYTHLGCTIHHKGDVRREVRRRFALAHSAFNAHRRILFQNKALEMSKRVEIFRTLILSKLLYGA